MKLFLVGGFLGSGKTTAIHQASLAFARRGIKVAVITNDQGADLVDTGFMESAGIITREVLHGCFCCNYNQLSTVIADLKENELPDIIFAESVGSCTDLVATIANPLATFNPGIEVVISVFADASLLLAIVSGNASFLNDDVRYIYKKQLEEADLLVVNKLDLLEEGDLNKIKDLIESEYNDRNIIYQSSLHEDGVQQWMNELNTFVQVNARTSLELDYDRYASGEAILAWLDGKITIETTDGTASHIALKLIYNISSGINAARYPIAHLKFLLNDGIEIRKISFTTINNGQKQVTQAERSDRVYLLVNARIQVCPSDLDELVSNAIQQLKLQTGCHITVDKKAIFQPGYPRPTHRIAAW